MRRPEARNDSSWVELSPILDQELKSLPQKYREVLILCDLEGNTRKQAAGLLGCPEGTVGGRLARGRVLLARRLCRKGIQLSGGALAAILANNAMAASVPLKLTGCTLHAATQVAAGHGLTGLVSASKTSLIEGVMKSMMITKLKLATTFFSVVGLAGLGMGAIWSWAAQPPAQVRPKPPVAVRPAPAQVGSTEATKPANEAKIEGEKPNIPVGVPLSQVLASLDEEGKLVIKTATIAWEAVPLPAPVLPPPPAGGGAGGVPVPAIARIGEVKMKYATQTQTFDLGDFQVTDVKGKKVDKKELAKLLKEETVAMASLYGQEVDPLHLRVLKEGILIFSLPAPKFDFPGGGIAPPPIAFPPGPGGFGGGGISIAVPATAPTPAVPPPPPEKPKDK
jgi:hypothetical protein